ncbi:hypothetical protein KY284_007137 [Solanum tuberosum]|nr:hypothetical protein KY284_007137 [Solanum tuberosum]
MKKNKDMVKFKVRCSKYLYKLCVSDFEKADKLKQSLPPVAPFDFILNPYGVDKKFWCLDIEILVDLPEFNFLAIMVSLTLLKEEVC